MKIDKSIGNWDESSTHLDDIAYSIYLNNYTEEFDKIPCILTNNEFKPASQYFFKKEVNNFRWYSWSHKYYEKAIIIMRRKKLLKIKERICSTKVI